MKEDEFFKKVGERVRYLRIKKGYTAYDNFAFSHDLPKNNVIRVESGKPHSLTTLLSIINALEISPEEFFKGIK
jgi:transcriptional regulator with XRE-family HTH domain